MTPEEKRIAELEEEVKFWMSACEGNLTEDDRKADEDPQLDEAVRILLEMIGQ